MVDRNALFELSVTSSCLATMLGGGILKMNDQEETVRVANETRRVHPRIPSGGFHRCLLNQQLQHQHKNAVE
jgi:hypothetical protein